LRDLILHNGERSGFGNVKKGAKGAVIMSFMDKQVMNIGTVSELTGLSERRIRYYENRKLISPKRTVGGTRKYSFRDIEKLVEIGKQMEIGWMTAEIRHRAMKRGTESAAHG
jgi:predicted transcriptional regulator